MLDLLGLVLSNLLTNRHLIVLLLVFYLAAYLAIRRAEARGERRDPWWGVALWVGVGALLGGRLAHVLPHLDIYLRHPLDLLSLNFGLNFYGGLAGGVLGAAVGLRRAGLSLGRLLVFLAPVLPFALALERFGCLVGPRACLGRMAPPSLGIYLPGEALSRFPSHLYEGLLVLAITALVLLVERRETRLPHRPFFLGLAGYGLIRALVDTTRGGWPGLWMMVDAGLGVALALASLAAIPLLPRLAPGLAGQGPKPRLVRVRRSRRRVRGR